MRRFFNYRLLGPKELDPEFFNWANALNSILGTSTPTIFDIGANVGQSVERFKAQWPDSVIHSFEPQLAEYQELVVAASRFSNVTCYHTALGEAVEEKTLVRHELYPATSGFFKVRPSSASVKYNVHPKGRFDEGQYSGETVTVDTVDRCMKRENVNCVDLLKISTQGYEREVLRGARSAFEDGRIRAIIVAVIFDDVYERESSIFDVEAEIRDYGFRLYDMAHVYKNLQTGRTHWAEIIYVNRAQVAI